MCGLVGVAGDVSYRVRTKIFKDMLDVCQLRGRDSTGVIKVTKDLEYDHMKQVGPPVYLYDSNMWDKQIEAGDAAALVGHCRHKTSGDVNRRNAHPFDFPEHGIIGVHNGTLRSHQKLDTYTYQKVDSEVLYGHLAQNGPEETFNKTEGAWACVWWNDQEKTLNFIRNDQRPLWFTWSKDARMMFWASEPWMFGSVARDIDLWDGGEQKQVYIPLPINTLWSFRLNPNAKGEDRTVTMRPAKIIDPAPEKKWNSHHFTPAARNTGGSTNHRVANSPSHWEKQADGTYKPVGKGGKVADPFQQGVQKGKEVLLLNDKLDDLTGTTQEEPGTTNMSNVSFLTHSAKRTESSTRPTNTGKSSRNILSLPERTSKSSQQTNSDVQCEKLESLSPRSKMSPMALVAGVSHRTVLGINYITDNRNSAEFSEDRFLKANNGICSFCKSPTSLEGVGTILNDKLDFICNPCLSEPNAVPFKAAC